ncbi:MAG TPA: XdhC family protein [Gemmatimonadaceae bacterium]
MTEPDLHETFEQLDELRRRERRVAMATLVSTKGTTPKKEGAKMWVGEGGRILGSVTIGGCVDARVVSESEEALAAGAPRLLSMSLGDEDAWDLGLTCGGMVEVLIEPVSLDRADDPVVAAYEAIRAESAVGRRSVAVVPLGGGGVRGRLVVRENGTTVGTLGDPALDRAAREQALDVIGRATSRSLALERGGEWVPLFFELHGPATTLVVFGAGHVAMPLARFARALGWRTIIADGRERYATRERFPEADEIRIGILSEIAEQLTYDASTFVVLVAHDYKFEVPVLRVLLQREPAYIGLLGNRKRGRAVLDFLAEEGVPREALARVHVPVGLDIGAQTAAEIALAMVAEAVAVRNGRPGTRLRDRSPV